MPPAISNAPRGNVTVPFRAEATRGLHVRGDGIQIRIYPELRGHWHLGTVVLSGVWTELPRPRGARTASLRADVAAAAGRITLPALCWYPLETGLRREAAEVPVVNVGSPHSQRGLSHEGGGVGSTTASHKPGRAGPRLRGSPAAVLTRHPLRATPPPLCAPPGAPEAPNVICRCDEWHRNSGCCGKFR